MSSQQHDTTAPITKKKPTKTTHVPTACINCKKAHLACDLSRPCKRCSTLGKSDSCIDIKHKKRGRPKLTSVKKWQQATTLTVNKPYQPTAPFVSSSLPSTPTPFVPLHASPTLFSLPISSFKMTASREMAKEEQKTPKEMMTMFLSMDLCCARISDESMQFLSTNPTQMGHCSFYDIIHPESSETLSRLHRILLDNCHRHVAQPISFKPASSETFLTTSAAQLLSIANGSQTIKETLKFKSSSSSLFECRFYLGGGLGGDLFVPNSLDQLYMVCLVTRRPSVSPPPALLQPINVVDSLLKQQPDYQSLLNNSNLMSLYHNTPTNDSDTIQLVNNLCEAIMSPTHSMEQPAVTHTNGYHSSSSCSSEDGDQHRHPHHYQPHHHQTASPSASPTTPPIAIQLHPPQQTYSNVLLNDFLEKPMDDLVGDLLHDNTPYWLG
ncbi:hypothetical protein MAM1_0113c05632 [Mucor ambiguus]|uniref:Zn(2)-C6 fungal-type domain-containing protein n=1 Tax=Mucor ambiguus TaxID=91626 RepID=A0A0C9MFW4_9FUNG|nr:hypothetical protein MAM1_0113c05632 [Mucor ambiguus]